ncbi:hypothetical protein [Rubrobacter radiotolerans]|uniref:Uncharacterized protein n=1 Tax=Rubrobacter radiotolerans TaxID=42256 RepID=A0AB35T4J2_RUBRA|nr:hypothetical protein [Rubrobacter radiotolerans]MDX5893705.1 hypothetical protein [Rubrobacter radiotolerans]
MPRPPFTTNNGPADVSGLAGSYRPPPPSETTTGAVGMEVAVKAGTVPYLRSTQASYCRERTETFAATRSEAATKRPLKTPRAGALRERRT